MDRDRKGGPPPEELGSFDVAKKSGADIAAEIARRMARWRSARKSPEAAERGPPAAGPAAHPPAAQSPAAGRQTPAPGQDVAVAVRVDRAQRIAAVARAPQAGSIRTRSRRAPAYGGEFRYLLAEGPNRNAIGMVPKRRADGPGTVAPPGASTRQRGIVAWQSLELRLDQACRRVNALGVAVWRALRPRFEGRIARAVQRTRALGAAARTVGSAGWQSLALESRIDQAKRQSHAFGVATRERSVATWQSLKPVLADIIRHTGQRAHAIGVAARELGASAWQQLRWALGHAGRHVRALGFAAWKAGVAAWHSPASRPVLAGTAAIAMAIAAWCLMQPHAPVPPDVAVTPAAMHPPAIAIVPTTDHPQRPPAFALAPALLAPQPRFAPEAGAPAKAGALFLAPMLKPALPEPTRPTLIARLKPVRSKATPDQPAPTAALPAKQAQETTEEIRKRADPRSLDSMLDDMFSDGLGRSLSRRPSPHWRTL